jgi:hypothetical protein
LIGFGYPSSQKLNERCDVPTRQESPITSSPEEATLLEPVANQFLLNEESIDMAAMGTCRKGN